MASDWLQLRAICERDVVYRSGQLARHGWAAALEGLHSTVSWRDGGIELSGTWEGTVSLGGQGLTFIPTVFVYPKVAMHYEEPWPKCLIYPARGIGTLRERPEPAPQALQELIGRTRAHLLQALVSPASTTQLALSMKLSVGSANGHLRALQRAGLLEAARDGRSVLYRRTPLGDMLAGT
jgi:DNA-binding transcriptional ArsR family regulator